MEHRREFLVSSAKFTAALAAFGLLGSSAATAEEAKANKHVLGEILKGAIEQGDMSKVLDKYQRVLSPDQKTTLEKLTTEDLKTLKGIMSKLAPLTRNGTNGNMFIY